MEEKKRDYGRDKSAVSRRARKEKIDFLSMGKRIQALRRQKGITQAEFAEDLGVSFQYISAIENGKGELSLDLLVAIANRLHVTTDELLGGSVKAVATPLDPDVYALLSDCDEEEKELYLRIAKAAKEAVREKRNT